MRLLILPTYARLERLSAAACLTLLILASPVFLRSADDAASKSGVSITGHFSGDYAGPHGRVRFWLLIENRSDVPITQVTLEHLDAPGFQVVTRCWGSAMNTGCLSAAEKTPQPIAKCLPTAANSDPSLLCAELPPGQSIAVWGEAATVELSHIQTSFAVVDWIRNGQAAQAVTNMGDIESLWYVPAAWRWLSHEWQLSLTVLGAILAAVLSWLKSRREKKAQQKAADAEKLAKTRERELAQRQLTWNMLLKEVQRMALRHYMPIGAAIQGLILYIGFVQDAATRSEDNSLAAFTYFLKFHWRIRRMLKSGASWYFKSLDAEELIVELIEAHRAGLNLNDPSRQLALDGFLEAIQSETDAHLIELTKNAQDGQKLFYEDFRGWAAGAGGKADLVQLTAIVKLITYETNRPYLYWYDELRPIPWDDAERKRIMEIAARPVFSDKGIEQRAQQYLADTSKGLNLKETAAHG